MKGKQYFYKLNIWISLFIIVIISIVFLNLKVKLEVENIKCKRIYEKRIASLLTSNKIENRKVMPIKVKNILTNNQKYITFADTTIIILLAKPQCDKCQEKELSRLKELRSKKNIEIIGITIESNIALVAIQKKLNRIDFPIYYLSEEIFNNNLSFSSGFPQIIYIVNGIVQSAFKPVPLDDEFSEKYYKELLNL